MFMFDFDSLRRSDLIAVHCPDRDVAVSFVKEFKSKYVSGFNVKRKNRRNDFVGLDHVIQFFDHKEDCYAMR